MNKFLPILLIIWCWGCGDEIKEKAPAVLFAGEIVNPTSEYVVLYKGEEVIDSARLDENNRFHLRLDSISEGLHHFYHHPEFQYMFLEAGDSIQIRLNTIDFDESLIFSGQGEEVNNFLLDMFLANEMEREQIYNYYQLEPEVFQHKIDSLKNEKIATLKEIDSETDLSDHALRIAKANIIYSYNIYNEAYPFRHKKSKGETAIHELPKDFYAYRKHIDYNDNSLTYLRPYYNFMKYHLGNLTYMNCKKDCDMEEMKGMNHLHFNRHKLKLIDSLIQQTDLRDNLYRNVAVDYLLKHDSEENYRVFIEEFHQLSHNNKHIDEINNLYESIRNMQPQKELPELLVENFDGDKVSLRDVAQDKEVVFYFWSAVDRGHFINLHKRISELQKKHPKYNFVGINLRTENNRWRGMVESSGLDKSNQFWAPDSDEFAHKLIVYEPNKSIICKDGKIVDAFANVYTSF